MTMGVTVYYAEISGSKEVKKRQQRVMMILESKTIPYEAIDITEAGKEPEKEFMMKNGKLRGDTKYVQSPQIFNGETYCGDYEDFDLANENDVLEEFLNTPRVDRSSPAKNGKIANGSAGASREGSSEPKVENGEPAVAVAAAEPEPVISTTDAPVSASPPPTSEDIVAEAADVSNTTENVKVNETKTENDDDGAEEEEDDEEEEKSQVDK